MTAKRPWWQTTTNPRLAVLVGGSWLIAGLCWLVEGILSGLTWLAVLGGLFLLCGLPWHTTAVVLVWRRHATGAGAEPEEHRPA
jgi:UPF0716 family protein affecting phage T7 exclusion